MLKRIVTFAGALALVGFATPSLACDCMMVKGKDLLRFGGEVFIGTVTSVEAETFGPAKLKIEKVYQGELPETATIESTRSDCFVTLKVGARYLVTTHLAEGGPVNQCTTFEEVDSQFERLVNELEESRP